MILMEKLPMTTGWSVPLADGAVIAIGATNNSANGNNSGHARAIKTSIILGLK